MAIGRPPIPTHLKVVRNVNGRKKPSPLEPKPVGDLREPPAHFDAEVREIWDYAIANSPRGLLKKIDSGVLEIWCKAHALHRTAVAEVRKTGLLVKAPNTGLPIQSPFLPIINKQALIMMRAIDHLGFSPASRTRIMLGEGPGKMTGGWDDIEAAI
jgi:P27 family predicted phage terminase small subunit